MYNISIVTLEVVVPGKVKMPPEYKKAAIRYNNSNVAVNPNFSFYMEDDKKIADKINSDSIASEIYFQVFNEHLKKQQFFDTIIEIAPFDYSDTRLSDIRVYSSFGINDSVNTDSITQVNTDILNFTKLTDNFSKPEEDRPKTKFIDPDFGLYSKEEIQQIADSTQADMLLSFDWFASVDGIISPESHDSQNITDMVNYNFRHATEVVYVISSWNFYDLRKLEMTYSYRKTDTIKWFEPAYSLKEAKRILPPRKDAVFNAADIAGSRFAEFLVPHWVEVERMYYQSGHTELKKTPELIKQNHWLEAAEIWKKNTTNKNKSIAAKSMFNMALACEINGDMDAAMDWAIKSFYVFGDKNPEHAFNCQDYIKILARRKRDIQKIENEPDNYNR